MSHLIFIKLVYQLLPRHDWDSMPPTTLTIINTILDFAVSPIATLVATHAAVITFRMIAKTDAPLSNALITIPSHPQPIDWITIMS